VTRRRPSIARLMAAIALVAASLSVFQTGHGEVSAWVDSYDSKVWLLGEVAPVLAIGMSGLALALLTTGRPRRFAAGLASTGFVAGLAFWLAPMSVRNFVLHRVILPVDARIGPGHSDHSATYLNWSLAWVVETEEHRRPLRTIRAPFVSIEAQMELGFLELAIASIGGLVAAIFRPKPQTHDRP
jgi:hypothetical protein